MSAPKRFRVENERDTLYRMYVDAERRSKILVPDPDDAEHDDVEMMHEFNFNCDLTWSQTRVEADFKCAKNDTIESFVNDDVRDYYKNRLYHAFRFWRTWRERLYVSDARYTDAYLESRVKAFIDKQDDDYKFSDKSEMYVNDRKKKFRVPPIVRDMAYASDYLRMSLCDFLDLQVDAKTDKRGFIRLYGLELSDEERMYILEKWKKSILVMPWILASYRRAKSMDDESRPIHKLIVDAFALYVSFLLRLWFMLHHERYE